MPAAKRRMEEGQEVSKEEKGRAYQLAATSAGVRPHEVRVALKLIDTEVESAVAEGLLTLPRARKIMQMTDDTLRAKAIQAAKKKEKGKVRELLDSPESTDRRGQPIPAALQSVFSAAGEFRKQTRKLTAVSDWLEKTIASPTGAALGNGPEIQSLRAVADAIEQAEPHSVCSFCDGSGCGICSGAGWLTKKALEAEERAARSAHRERASDGRS